MFGWRRKRDNAGGESTRQPPTEESRLFSIGGMRVSFQKTRSHFRLTAEGDPVDTRGVFRIIAHAVRAGGRNIAYTLDAHGRMDIKRPEGMTRPGAGPPPASAADVLHALECLQAGIRTRDDLLDRDRRDSDRQAADYRAGLEREAANQTAPYLSAAVRYLSSIGRPLGEEHQAGLRDALAEAYIESLRRR